ncbi:14131_t:CDS:1, partial [Rhizophagus irregularis]
KSRLRDAAFKVFITTLMQEINTSIWNERSSKFKQWELHREKEEMLLCYYNHYFK